MTAKSCIMQTNDFVTRDDVDALTTEQWNKFREYLRGCGYNIDDDLGNKFNTSSECALRDYSQSVVMDADGDLFWKEYTQNHKGVRITKDQILSVINGTSEMKSNTCIMQPGDYVTIDTVERMKSSEWYAFRAYLKQYGHNINPTFGLKKRPALSIATVVVLDDVGDLVWNRCPEKTGKEITLEQIRSVISHTEETMEIDEIKNKIRFHESEITKLNSMIENRKIGMALDVIAKSLKEPNVSIKIDGDSKLIQELVERLQIKLLTVDVKCSSIVYTPPF